MQTFAIFDTRSMDGNSSAPASADPPDNSISSSGIIATVFFGSSVLIALCYLGYLLLCKIRNHRQQQKLLDDQENSLLNAQSAPQIRPMSYFESNEKFNNDTIQIVVHQPDLMTSRPAEHHGTHVLNTSATQFSPRRVTEFDTLDTMSTSPPQSPLANIERLQICFEPSSASRQSLRRYSKPSPAVQRFSDLQKPSAGSSPTPLSPTLQGHLSVTGQSPPLLTTPAIHPPPPAHRSPLSSLPTVTRTRPRSRPTRLHFPLRASKPSPPLSRSFSPTSSSALLMEHPATMGRRVGDVSPGLDPDYPYPMTPAQVGYGRAVDGWGRGAREA
ncbi:hypothetical protein MMC13_007635 [Lambiella insularis]|nr:hypothetical protein [Lambiella insularis]